ncbi:hypothetical protein [Synechococcus sp. MIT S9504]|uniref:hypothetical protein n=1 Tax=Synechococcus sp. MIT S9504 TaxID=1801628 RepID=UPI0007BB3080|nr:hypothetical protein [Synechococcus sp. MIT S9504]KZR85000.1 hypothetical protein MITS9504_02435 [Synechococcus sp. MIT S9504]
MIFLRFFRKFIDIFWAAVLSGPDKYPSKCDVLFFCHDSDRGLQLDGRAYSPLIDSLREEFEILGLVSSVVAHPFSRLIGSKAWANPVSLNRKHFAVIVLSCFFNKVMLDTLLFSKVFKSCRARVVITIGCSEGLCLAARKLDILHLELLHGYGYDVIPWGLNSRKTSHLPKAILSMDSVSTETFLPIAQRGIKILEIPNPFIKKFVGKNSSYQPLPSNDIYPIAKSYVKRIIVLLQWGYDGDHGKYTHLAGILDNGLFPKKLEQVIIEMQEVFWHFRLHPVQHRGQKYSAIRERLHAFCSIHSNCEWQTASSLPLPSLARICSGSVSMSSMASYECANFGLKSLLLCPSLRDGNTNAGLFEDLVSSGYAVKSSAETSYIKSWIDEAVPLKSNLLNTSSSASWQKAIEWILANSGLDRQVSKN